MLEHCKENNVHFEYTHHWDREESVFRNAVNMKTLRRRFKKKITTKGGKGQDEQDKADEESRKQDEESQSLAQEATGWLQGEEEEKRRDTQEASKRQKKMLGMKKKKRKERLMRSYRSKKQKGQS